MSTILERMQYGFDRDSRRTWRRRALTSGQDNSYGYDGLSQVTAAALGTLNLNATAIGGVPAMAEAWDYDPSGNWRGYRVEADGSVSLDQSRVHDKGNRLTQVVGDPNPVVLDPVGRMLEVSPDAAGDWENSQQITWDAWSRVTQVTDGSGTTVLGSYSYDGLSRRGTRTVGDTITHCYYSDAWRPLEERTNDETTPSMQYYWGARHRDDLVRRDRATTDGGGLDETRYVLMDYFSPAAITDESGTVTERYAFSAFGVRQILAPDFSPRTDSECAFAFAFQGKFIDSESGFMNYGYRYYSPELGRWLSKDPIEEAGGLNLYAYASQNPIGYIDLFGLDTQDEAGAKAADLAAQKMQQSKGIPADAPAVTQAKSEFGGRIYQNPDGTYGFTFPHETPPLREVDGNSVTYTPHCNPYRNANGSPVQIPPGTKDAGTYHSHESKNTASDSDKAMVNSRITNPNQQPSYIGSTTAGVNKVTPAGNGAVNQTRVPVTK